MRPMWEVLSRLRRRRRSREEREARCTVLVLREDARRWFGVQKPAIGSRDDERPSVPPEAAQSGGQVVATLRHLKGWDGSEAMEHGEYDVRNMLNWLHYRNRNTGRGFWMWNGKGKHPMPVGPTLGEALEILQYFREETDR